MKKVLNNSFFQKQAYYKEKPKRANRKQISTVNNSLIFSMLSIFISGLLGGVAFSIGATAYLSICNKAVGAAVFAVGMFMIFAYGFGFFSSKIGYALNNNKQQNLNLLPLWLGNLIGAISVGALLSLTRENILNTIYTRANQLCLEQVTDSPFSIIILSFFCGIVMFVVTDNFKNAKDAAQRYLALFLGTMTFLLCGFDHFVTSAFFYTVTNALGVKAFWCIMLVTLGNSLGALTIPFLHICVKKLQDNAKK
ncbi:MAG: formate/nitrite transporter family protein [Clostridia bacterium]|nr:formate/nitrite transporter family protein [Clostridia bacterium]